MSDFYQDQETKKIYQNGGMVNTGGGIMRLHIYSNFEPKESIMVDLNNESDFYRYREYEYPKPKPASNEERIEQLEMEVKELKRKVR
jgi:hypothetical protein